MVEKGSSRLVMKVDVKRTRLIFGRQSWCYIDKRGSRGGRYFIMEVHALLLREGASQAASMRANELEQRRGERLAQSKTT